MTQVFISYSRKDLSFIERLAADLQDYGFAPWYDLSNLDGGVRWIGVIEQAITDSQYAIVVLSPDSMESEYVEDEISFARRLRKKIIPLYYRPCKLGMLYVNLNYIDVQGENYRSNFDRILRALNVSMPVEKPAKKKSAIAEEPKAKNPAKSPISNSPITNKLTLSNGMEFMRVPAGKFLMGSKHDNKLAYDDEKPQHTVNIPYDYWMARYPVTNEIYNVYIESNSWKHPENGWENKKDYPVVRISWKDAMEYCRWLNGLLKAELPSGLVLRLPTEAEWEKAARGIDGSEYPWGNQFDKYRCITSANANGGSVGLCSPQGDSPFGCSDMSGNVWEWTHSLKKEYPYNPNDGREDKEISGNRVLRGGSYLSNERDVRCAYRFINTLVSFYVDWGFRICLTQPLRN